MSSGWSIVVDAHGQLAALPPRPTFAAHSMDTHWYVVDRDGQVARAWSDLEGAVPWTAYVEAGGPLVADLLALRVAREREEAPPSSRELACARRRSLVHVQPWELPWQWTGVLQFASDDYLAAFRDEFYPRADDYFWRIPFGGALAAALPRTVVAREIPRAGFTDYWDAGAIEAALWIDHCSPADVGLYEYGCEFSGPYRRRVVPGVPLLLHELPAEVQRLLGGARVRFAFHDQPAFDPEEQLGDCRRYGR
ncbi:MAG: hypothetical protein R3B48_24655 [Kofleriaceae bacterium]